MRPSDLHNGNPYTDEMAFSYGSGHEGAAVLLPGFAINW